MTVEKPHLEVILEVLEDIQEHQEDREDLEEDPGQLQGSHLESHVQGYPAPEDEFKIENFWIYTINIILNIL